MIGSSFLKCIHCGNVVEKEFSMEGEKCFPCEAEEMRMMLTSMS